MLGPSPQAFVHGLFRRDNRPIKFASRLGLTVSKHPTLSFDQTYVFLGSTYVPQFECVTALTGHGWFQPRLPCAMRSPSPLRLASLQSRVAEQARGTAGAENMVTDKPKSSQILFTVALADPVQKPCRPDGPDYDEQNHHHGVVHGPIVGQFTIVFNARLCRTVTVGQAAILCACN